MESVGAVGGAGGVALPSSLALTGAGSSGIGSGVGGGYRFSSQLPTGDTLKPPKPYLHTHTTTASKTVRKVHKIPATSEGDSSSSKPKSSTSGAASKPPPSGASGLITTSSWRAGKELRDKVLKGEDKDHRVGGSRRREDISPAHYSSVSESLSNLSSSQENISAVSSSIDVHVQPERNRSESPTNRAKTKDGVGSHTHGGRVALDVAGMLKDLEGSESPPHSPSFGGKGGGGGGEVRERERLRLGQARSTTSASGGPTSKKPRYNYGESTIVVIYVIGESTVAVQCCVLLLAT